MLKIFKPGREVYSGAEIRERVDYYENESNRISEPSKSNVELAISGLKALKDGIEAEHHYFDKLLFQTIITSFEDDNALVADTYIEFIPDIAAHLHGTNNSKYLFDNIDEFRHALAYTDIRDLLNNERTYSHHQAANVGRDLRVTDSGNQGYVPLSRAHAFLINPGNEPYKEVLEVRERTDGSLFDNETLKGYINKKLMNGFR